MEHFPILEPQKFWIEAFELSSWELFGQNENP